MFQVVLIYRFLVSRLLPSAFIVLFLSSSFAQDTRSLSVKRPTRPSRSATPVKNEFSEADPDIAAMLKEISAERIQATIEKLVSFGNRSTLSAQDDASIAAGKGIGAARE